MPENNYFSPNKKFRKFARLRDPWRKFVLSTKARLGYLGRPKIVAYRAYGNQEYICVRGHVIEDKGMSPPRPNDSIWKNMLAMLKRFLNETLPHVALRIQIGNQVKEIQTNEKGYFQVQISNPQLECGWHQGEISLVKPSPEDQANIQTNFSILIPHPTSYGVISDIDDTFLVSHATRYFKKIWLLLSRNAHTRKPFEGIVQFYQALHEGMIASQPHPFFYVSSSEWNLYDFIREFCRFQQMPDGVFLLKDLKVKLSDFWRSGGGDHSHKVHKIREILKTYPDYPFILIGDNGQQDPENYRRIAQEFSSQIKLIYIRNVRRKRASYVEKMREELEATGVETFLFEHSRELWTHAFEKNLLGTSTEKVFTRKHRSQK